MSVDQDRLDALDDEALAQLLSGAAGPDRRTAMLGLARKLEANRW